MKQKGFAPIIILLTLIIGGVVVGGVYYFSHRPICPYAGWEVCGDVWIPPVTITPTPNLNPSPSPEPLVDGQSCNEESECLSGLACHNKKCTSPTGDNCSGPDDTSCPTGYTCIQGCGLPVARDGDSPPRYYCLLNELAAKPRPCPICLASNTMISTPNGSINVREIKVGTVVWTVDKQGYKIAAPVLKVSSTNTPPNHHVVHLILADGRKLYVSPNHPTIDSKTAGQLKPGDSYSGSVVTSSTLIPYWDTKTYDLLPDNDTGFYWANGILMASTLK